MSIFTHHISALDAFVCHRHTNTHTERTKYHLSKMQMIRSLLWHSELGISLITNSMLISFLCVSVFSLSASLGLSQASSSCCVSEWVCVLYEESGVQIFMGSIRLNWDLKEQSVSFCAINHVHNGRVLGKKEQLRTERNGTIAWCSTLRGDASKLTSLPITARERNGIGFFVFTRGNQHRFYQNDNQTYTFELYLGAQTCVANCWGKRIKWVKASTSTFWLTSIYILN